MKVGIWVNKGNRDVYVAKGSDAKALTFGSDVKISGYVNATNNNVAEDSPLYGYMLYQKDIATKGTEGTDAYVIAAGNRPVWVYLTFSATAGETYYIFNKILRLVSVALSSHLRVVIPMASSTSMPQLLPRSLFATIWLASR